MQKATSEQLSATIIIAADSWVRDSRIDMMMRAQ